MTLRALIFDVDGTLAETEEIHRRAFNETFAAHGLDWHWDRATYARLLRVTGGKERMRAWRDGLGHALPDDVTIAAMHGDKTGRYGAILAQGVALRPGVAALLRQARARGLALAVATTTSPANVEALTRACWGRPARQVFDVIAAGDEVAAKKPAPDVYLLALARLGLSPDCAIAFEDSLNGLRSAQAAGLRVVATPGIYTAQEDLSAANWLLESLDGVLPRLTGSAA